MPKMIVSIDGVVIKEVQLTKDRTTLGRRPYNDVVIDNLAISGEHAVFQMTGNDVFIEDLNSTNGTYVNGKAAKKQQLVNGDTVEVGKYKIKFVSEVAADGFEKTMMVRPGMVPPTHVPPAPVAASPAPFAAARPAPAPLATSALASIKVLSGAAAGREVPGCRGGCDHQAAARFCRPPCRRCWQPCTERRAHRNRTGAAQER